MVKLKVDVAKCQGYGNCVSAAADVYDVDDDGKVILLKGDTFPEADRARLEAAARSCPVSALSVEST
jgi:ferredoxin